MTYELAGVLYREWRAAWRRGDVTRSARKISGYIAAVVGISLAVNVILSAPQHRSDDSQPGHQVVNGLHIAMPNNFRDIPIEQLVPLP
jgi:hypothetical protein